MKALNTGVIEFDIPFDTGYVGKLKFNPNDIDFYDKLCTLESKLMALYSEYEGIEATKENYTDVIKKMRDELCPKVREAFDELFGDGASEVIFKYASPLAFVNDEYYPYYFLKEFLPEVEKKIDTTIRKVKINYERLSKHAVKYAEKRNNVGSTDNN